MKELSELEYKIVAEEHGHHNLEIERDCNTQQYRINAIVDDKSIPIGVLPIHADWVDDKLLRRERFFNACLPTSDLENTTVCG